MIEPKIFVVENVELFKSLTDFNGKTMTVPNPLSPLNPLAVIEFDNNIATSFTMLIREPQNYRKITNYINLFTDCVSVRDLDMCENI